MARHELFDFVADIESYAGGQISILRGDISKGTHEHYCGTIERITSEENLLKVKLAWNAKLTPLKTRPDEKRWTKHDELDYIFDLNNYDLWEGFDHANDRPFSFDEGFILRSNSNKADKESLHLKSPKVKTRLNPLRVRGLC